MKLSLKIPIIIIIISIISTVSASLFIYNSIKSSLEVADAKQQYILATETLDKIDLFLNERFSDVQSIATRPRVVDVITGQNGFNKTEAERLRLSFKELSTVYVSWASISVIDLNGKEVLTTDATASANILVEDPIYKSLFERATTGQSVYSDVFFSKKLNSPSMVFFSPVFSDLIKKKVIGVLEVHMDWNAVQNLLEGQTGPLAHLYNQQGFVIATNDLSQKGNVLKENNSKIAIFQAALLGNASQTLPGTHGDTALVSYVHELGHGSYKGNGWILTLETPASVAFAPAISSGIQIAMLTAISIVLGAILILFMLFRFIISPINKLTQTTRDIASGNLAKRIDINSKDEFGILADSFNEMASKLQDLYQNLENKVNEKTLDLEKKVEEADTAKRATLNVMEDLNEEKNRVEQGKARDEAILLNIGDGLIATDEKGMIQVINQSAQHMLGWTAEEVIGKLFTELVPLEDGKGNLIPDEIRPLTLAIKGKSSNTSLMKNYQMVRKDGSKFAVWNIVSPVILNNNIIGGVVAFRDVTKEEQIDRMKTEFISLASHQLRTPLSAIKWFAELLADTKLDKEQLEFSNNIALSTERMIELVNSLLNVSRIELGRIIIAPTPTDLGELLKGTIKELQQIIDKKQLTLNVNVAPDLAKINIDPALIRQVYMNLLTNAIKYTSVKGKISIVISIKDKDIISQVIDTGIGISEADKNKVFTKFYRSADAIKLEPNGNGLGLYLAKAIVESSQGKMGFESESGKGTTFWFSLPLSGSKPKTGEVLLDS